MKNYQTWICALTAISIGWTLRIYYDNSLIFYTPSKKCIKENIEVIFNF